MSFTPATRRPNGVPLYWMHETGELPNAVRAYLMHAIADEEPPSPQQTVMLRDYLEQWIFAPYWDYTGSKFHTELGELRRLVKTISTVQDIRSWLALALDIGIDPL